MEFLTIWTMQLQILFVFYRLDVFLNHLRLDLEWILILEKKFSNCQKIQTSDWWIWHKLCLSKLSRIDFAIFLTYFRFVILLPVENRARIRIQTWRPKKMTLSKWIIWGKITKQNFKKFVIFLLITSFSLFDDSNQY